MLYLSLLSSIIVGQEAARFSTEWSYTHMFQNAAGSIRAVLPWVQYDTSLYVSGLAPTSTLLANHILAEHLRL